MICFVSRFAFRCGSFGPSSGSPHYLRLITQGLVGLTEVCAQQSVLLNLSKRTSQHKAGLKRWTWPIILTLPLLCFMPHEIVLALYKQLVSTNICMTVYRIHICIHCGFHCLPLLSFAFISHFSFPFLILYSPPLLADTCVRRPA